MRPLQELSLLPLIRDPIRHRRAAQMPPGLNWLSPITRGGGSLWQGQSRPLGSLPVAHEPKGSELD